ncbi:MAG: inositol-3-phosphate synthase [Planctomycetes bacterium]|nr:inositol-3-phosphate synthase [Planctomycetota bacterium]
MPGGLGVWLVGARGAVATTAVAGAAALARGLAPATGLVTARPPLDALKLAPLDRLVFGGHDVVDSPPEATLDTLVAGGVLPQALVAPGGPVREAVREAAGRVRPGSALGAAAPVAARATWTLERREPDLARVVERLRSDMARFVDQVGVDRAVVVHLASTEPAGGDVHPACADLARLRRAVASDDRSLPASVLYALAALEAGLPYVNFTPSAGNAVEALQGLALDRGVPHMGRDGKTGETLLKSVLAPLFAARNLRVLSWSGFNLLGNADGETLTDPAALEAKTRTKRADLAALLDGQAPHTTVGIDFVPSLGDWKTAWDHVHFEGFLGTRMSLQFTWQGCDSALAAPLVLDLARLADLAARRGERGLMPHLACFFKQPLGVDRHDFAGQFQMLLDYAAAVRAGT